MSDPNLRGPKLWPAAARQYFQENGYLPPGIPDICNADCPAPKPHCPHHYDPQRLPAGLRSGRTLKNWGTAYRLLQERHPDKRVNEFTEQDLVDFLVQGRDRRTGASWAPYTVRSRQTAVRAFFDWASWRGLVKVNPAEHLHRHVKVRAQGQKAHTWLRPEEVGALVRACAGITAIDARDRIAIELAVNTGLRCHELTGLRWSDVNLFGRRIQVVGKGGKPANIPLNGPLLEALLEWRGRYAQGLGHDVTNEPVLSGARNRFGEEGVELRWGHQLGDEGLRAVVGRRGALIGLPQLRPHDLRRTYAGLLEAKGVPLRKISERLRHSNIAVTERYLEGNPLKEDQAELEEALY